MPSCTAEWHAPDCPLSEFSGEIDDSEVVDGALLDEWDELTRRERSIVSRMNSIRDVIYQKYPDLEKAVVVLKDIRAINHRTPLQRRACLMSMKGRALNMVDVARMELTRKLCILKTKLDEIRDRIAVIEEMIKFQVIWSYKGERAEIDIEEGMQ